MKVGQQNRWLTSATKLAFFVACVLSVSTPGMGQYPVTFSTSQSTAKSTTLESASLQTITDQELFKLRRAQEFADEGDSLSAITLWQSVLDSAGSKLMTRDEWSYSSTRHEYPKYVTVAYEIESILSGLPEDALELYRIKADGEARAILANPDERSRAEVLSEVVRRFFASSIGDDAAFELACLRLDRFEFTDASRLLRKCLQDHPDCSIPRHEVLLRLAVADGRIGDSESASESLSKLAVSDDPRVALIRDDVSEGSARSARFSAENNGNWLLKYGTSDRTAMMPSVPDTAFPANLSELWTHEFDMRESPNQVNPNQIYGGMYGAGYGSMYLSRGLYISGGVTFGGIPAQAKSKPSYDRIDRRLLIDQWKERGWTPVGGMLFFDGRVYFKSQNRVVCCSAATGEMIWMGIENDFEIDPKTRQKNVLSVSMPAQAQATLQKPEQIQLFGDQVYQAMSIGDGNLYAIEGRSELDPPAPQVQAQQNPYVYGMSLPSRARRNWLAAYHATSGKLRWRRTAYEREGDEDSKFDVGFSCAPVSGAGLTYVTLNDSGSLWLVALNSADGTTAWKTFLCDEPAGSCDPWAATGIAYAEGDVYVATGAGIVIAVDGTSGALRWVVRYQRSGDAHQAPNPYGMQYQVSEPNGWREDVVVATGRVVVVMGSDSDEIFALDRRTGEVLWDSPRESKGEAEYYLGMSGNRLYVGADKMVRCYDAAGGRVVWETTIDESSGTGIVTRDAIYVPAKASIVKLSLEDGNVLGQSKFTSMSREPVGNLYSDGNRLFGVGAARVYAFTDLRERLANLDQRVVEKDLEAILERARFRTFQSKLPDTWNDVRLAYQLLAAASNTESFEAFVSEELNDKPLTAAELACDVVLQLFDELGLPTASPKETLSQLMQMRSVLANSDTKVARDNLILRCDSCLYRSLTAIQSNQKKGLANEILSVARFCDRDHLNRRARQAMATTALATDLEALKKALESEDSLSQQIAIVGLAPLGEQGTLVLTSRLKQDIPAPLQLEIAIALLNVGQPSGLEQLGKLLTSANEDVQLDALTALVSVTGRKRDNVFDEQAIKRWQEWIASNQGTLTLRLPYVPSPEPRGRTLVCYMNGIVEEFDLAGKSQWKINTQGPAAACGLSNGHRLIASTQQKRVTEYDTTGKKVWNIGVDGHPTRVYRLENGNTLVATQQPNRVYEYRPDGSVAWKYSASSNVMDARRMQNGNTLIAFQTDRVIQVNPSGERVWELTGLSNPVGAQPLPNGNILVALGGNSRVAEYGPEKNLVWAQGSLNGLLDAMRLPDGNTLVAAQSGIQLYSPEGKTLNSGIPKRSNGNNQSNGFIMSGGAYIQVQNDQQLANRIFRY